MIKLSRLISLKSVRVFYDGKHYSLREDIHGGTVFTPTPGVVFSLFMEYKSITNDNFITVLYHDREFRLFCDSHHQPGSVATFLLLIRRIPSKNWYC